LILAAWSVLPVVAANDTPAAEKVSPEALVRDLGDERYPVRVNASHELWQLGGQVEELLKRAEASESVEVALRAREIRRKIQLGIHPDSPPEIAALASEYDGAPASRRVEIVRELKELGAWPQVLRLNAYERDPETRELLAEEIEGVPVRAAREFLSRDEPDFDRAREMLELGHAGPSQMLALAAFHRARGTLGDEIARARALRGHRGHLWRYALLAVAGRPLEAAREAEEAAEFLAAARLRLLGGDPSDYLAIAPIPGGTIAPHALDAYREAVIGKWRGDPAPRAFIDRLADTVTHAEDDQSWRSLAILYALGEIERADPLFERMSPGDAFYHYQLGERIDPALEALGLDPAAPDYSGWLRGKLERIAENPGESEADLKELKYLGYFLEQRGRHDALREGLAEPLADLAESDPEWFAGVAGYLFPSTAQSLGSMIAVIGPVTDAAGAFIDADPSRVGTVLEMIFGGVPVVTEVWDSLGEFRPDLGTAERLRATAKLLGRMPDADDLAAAWRGWIGETRKQAADGERARLFGLELTLAMYDTDAHGFLDLAAEIRAAGLDLDSLGMFSESYAFERFEWQCLNALARHGELVERLRKRAEARPDDLVAQAALAAVLRRSESPEEAAEVESRIEFLILSDVSLMGRIASAYAEYGCFGPAATWWRRAMMESVDEDSEFVAWGYQLADEMKEQGNWKVAASLAEMVLLDVVMTEEEILQPMTLTRLRVEADMGRALDRLGRDPEASRAVFERCYRIGRTDGSMADYFFPAIRAAGLKEEHDRWFEDSWQTLNAVIERFPESHNTMNTAAWTASRANRRLDEAEAWSRRSLELAPGQAAYLDTLAEVWFARGNREKAIEWGARAVARQPYGAPILRQYRRFLEGPFPVD
jgi:tetratricopeptide (TPR) repeat protein